MNGAKSSIPVGPGKSSVWAGKLKPWLLRKLYTEKELQSMLELKALFDPEMRLNPGNIFGAPATSL